MFYTSQYSPGGRERGQNWTRVNCAWSPPSDPLVTYSSLQVTDTGKRQCYRLTDLMQVVGGGAKIGRGFTAKTFAGLTCIRPFFSSCILQSYSELETNNLHPTWAYMPGFKPKGTGHDPFMMQLSAQDSLTFIRLGNPTWDFLGVLLEAVIFFFWFGFCYYTLNVRSRDEVKGNIRTRRKTKVTGFPMDLTLSVLLYNFWAFTSTATKE